MRLMDCRDFLSRYAAGESYKPYGGPLRDGINPPSVFNDHQTTVGWPVDGHVIPREKYEHRLQDATPSDDEVRAEEVLHFLEAEWDTAVGAYGLDGVTGYTPFHTDEQSYGVYIPQRCIRSLGHLLDGWARELTAEPDTPPESIYLDATTDANPQSPFESLTEAFDLAEELLVRYRWVDHQLELLATHLADFTGIVAYDVYYDQNRRLDADETATRYRLLRQLDRSAACRRLAPSSLYDPLLRRMTAAFTNNNDNALSQLSSESSQALHRQQVSVLSSAFDISTTHSEGFLADELPFRRLDRSVPTRIQVYITRREPDSDYGTITNQPGTCSLDVEQRPISRTDEFERSYRKADGTLKRDVDNLIEDIRNRFEHQTWKGMSFGPKDKRYIDVTGSKRLVVQIDDQTKTVTLLDFGSHDLPRQHGFNKV
ncbi:MULTISPECIES: type II toxin-antitoxin system RelE family toxin [Haloarcula]|uniref:type II toxin-antitoxin system RelE family toxin n=1 Tax=Haloarcula TaxID=2237 RepID=UPI0023EAA247|nr:hypothetical protein [Halomicroarcula sp. XH51]